MREAGQAGSLGPRPRGRAGSQCILPSWIFFQASEAVKMHESRMPATVKVPPMMAQICKGGRSEVSTGGSAKSVRSHNAGPRAQQAPPHAHVSLRSTSGLGSHQLITPANAKPQPRHVLQRREGPSVLPDSYQGKAPEGTISSGTR